MLRGIICYTILFYLLVVHGRHLQKWITGFLIFYGASSFATVWYENGTMATISMALNFVSLLILLFYIVPKFDLKKVKKSFTLLFIILVVVNGYLLYQLLEMMKEMTLNYIQYIFMLLSAFCTILLAFLALVYNHFYNSTSSMSFTALAFLIIFAEIFRGIGYYGLAYSVAFVYLARIFLVLSLCVLGHISFIEKNGVKSVKTSYT
jgi:apolipoprotein N-acyltransferase